MLKNTMFYSRSKLCCDLILISLDLMAELIVLLKIPGLYSKTIICGILLVDEAPKVRVHRNT